MNWMHWTCGVGLATSLCACNGDEPLATANGGDSTGGEASEPSAQPGSDDDAVDTPADETSTTTTSATTDAADDESSGDDGTTTGEPPWNGEPLPDGDPGQWQWVDVEGTECIDGTPTGVGVRRGTGDGLVIYFEGGGGCFDAASCALFYATFANFDENAFNLLVPTLLSGGIFDDEDTDNPVADWSMVYVPYCTGDVHAGDKDLGGVPGFLGSHQFVGYRNFGLDLERIGSTFPEPSHVLVTGISAGGYGAALNYDRIADAYAYSDAPITLLDDSGPPMGESVIPLCMQDLWTELWNLEQVLPSDCEDCFGDEGWVRPLTHYLRDQHPDQNFGLVSNLRDSTIRTFLGAGQNDCAGGFISGNQYQQALLDFRDEVVDDAPNWATFFVDGIGHTFLPFGSYASTEVEGVELRDWLGKLLSGTAEHHSDA
ncbi:MAG: pectin acetylesterase-family hydrolase [Myxococcota bacterium]